MDNWKYHKKSCVVRHEKTAVWGICNEKLHNWRAILKDVVSRNSSFPNFSNQMSMFPLPVYRCFQRYVFNRQTRLFCYFSRPWIFSRWIQSVLSPLMATGIRIMLYLDIWLHTASRNMASKSYISPETWTVLRYVTGDRKKFCYKVLILSMLYISLYIYT